MTRDGRGRAGRREDAARRVLRPEVLRREPRANRREASSAHQLAETEPAHRDTFFFSVNSLVEILPSKRLFFLFSRAFLQRRRVDVCLESVVRTPICASEMGVRRTKRWSQTRSACAETGVWKKDACVTSAGATMKNLRKIELKKMHTHTFRSLGKTHTHTT